MLSKGPPSIATELNDEDAALRAAMTLNAAQNVKHKAANPKMPRTKTKPMKPVKKTDGAAAPKKAASSLKRPAAATDGRPPTPGNSVVYRDARCYYSAPKQGFRCVLNPSQNPSDRFFTFKDCSEKEAWNSVIKFVDENRK